MTDRVYNHKPSPPGARGTCELEAMPRMRAGMGARAAVIDNTALVVQVLRQGSLGSCELNGWGEAIQSEMWREAGKPEEPPELPSRLGMYLAAQIMGGYFGQGDTGTCSYDVARAASEFGFCPESQYPYQDDPASLEPGTFMEQLKRLCYDQRFESVARVDSDGMSVYDCDAAVARALGAGYLLPFAIDVDVAFENLMPGEIWPGPRTAIKGGHCTTIVGRGPASALCPFTESSEVVLKMLNSWGTEWCSGGYYLMRIDALARRYDIWAATKTPTYSGTV